MPAKIGRPATGQTKTKKSVTIATELLAAAEHAASTGHSSLSALIERALDEYLKVQTPQHVATARNRIIHGLPDKVRQESESRANIVQISESAQDSARSAFPEVPLLRAAAGFPILADAEMVEPDRDLGPGRFLLELRGDSMEPRFKDRQRVILRDKTTLRRPVLKYGEFYCFVHEGQACFKQWAKDSAGNKVLRSLNKAHADIPANGDTDWIGWLDKADNI